MNECFVWEKQYLFIWEVFLQGWTIQFLAIHLLEVGPYNLYTNFILIESSHYLYNMSRLEFGVFLAPIRIQIIDFSFCVDSKLVVVQAIIDSRQTPFTLVILWLCVFAAVFSLFVNMVEQYV